MSTGTAPHPRHDRFPTRAARLRPAPGALPVRGPPSPRAPGEPRPHARFQESLWDVEVTNRFKGLDLIDRVPEELCMELCDTVQEAVIKIIPKKKKCKKAKWLSEDTLKISEKRREAKGKEETERYKHLNAEFQRIARRDKKAFLSDQCKEIEENNRMGKTRDLFKKIRNARGTFHAKMAQ